MINIYRQIYGTMNLQGFFCEVSGEGEGGCWLSTNARKLLLHCMAVAFRVV